MSAVKTKVPAVEGWFTLDDEPRLLGKRRNACGCVYFPQPSTFCRNPDCQSDDLVEVPLSSRGRIWSYTDSQYQPPPPYMVQGSEFEPFAIAAVER